MLGFIPAMKETMIKSPLLLVLIVILFAAVFIIINLFPKGITENGLSALRRAFMIAYRFGTICLENQLQMIDRGRTIEHSNHESLW